MFVTDHTDKQYIYIIPSLLQSMSYVSPSNDNVPWTEMDPRAIRSEEGRVHQK